jgi:glycosyltransferase involved in cell wall biosynthesis
LHTVLAQPSLNQRAVIERLAELSARIVVQTEVARTRLLENHRVPPRNVVVIPHGAPANLTPALQLRAASYRPTILTWGLIGPSKGIEYAIEAMAQLRDLDPLPRYVVMGETHPKIVHASGEEYRLGLIERARELGVDEIVAFEDGYRDTAGILARVRSADIILLPYLSRDQVVSGVLVEAIASGKPVVSTAFPHAVEVLEAGSGIVIPHEDVDAMADALRAFLTDRQTLARAAFVARAQAPDLFWESVGRSYDALAAEIVGVRALAC